ncbi:unnamed protein product [Ectocarpus sp. 12 AP-2014]
MHLCGRAPFTFNEQNLAAIRKVFSPGPLPLLAGYGLEAFTSTAAVPRASETLRSERGRSRAVRRAAVLVPLCNRDGVASLLFTVRSSKVSTHKGQVSFPGGHLEPGEDAVEAALRETREEIGDSLGRIDVLGTCHTLPAITGTPVTPVVAFVRRDVGPLLPKLVLSPDEVESVFTLSLSELLDPSLRTMDDLGGRGKLPAFTAGPQRVWGLTAAITDGVLRNGIVPLLQQQRPEGDGSGNSGSGSNNSSSSSSNSNNESSSSSSSSSVGDDDRVPGDRDGVDKEGPRRSSL